MARDGTEWETYENKICKECQVEKAYDKFAINQYGKNNRILRRPVCIECYSKKKQIPAKLRKQYYEKFPPKALGEEFQCPVCNKKYIRKFNNDTVLDHNHDTGEIRGYLCGSCNASIGKFNEDTDILARAILWLNGDLKNYE